MSWLELDPEPPRVVSASPAAGATIDQTSHVPGRPVQRGGQPPGSGLAGPGGHRRGDLHRGARRGQVFPPARLVRPRDPHGHILDAGWPGRMGNTSSTSPGRTAWPISAAIPSPATTRGATMSFASRSRGPTAGCKGTRRTGTRSTRNLGSDTSQDLGVLFPNEVQAGVTLRRGPASNGGDPLAPVEEVYRFRVLRGQSYLFRLDGPNLPDGARIVLTDGAGNDVMIDSLGSGRTLFGHLDPGTYSIRVMGWTSGESAGVEYELRISAFESGDNPAPLLDGPAPAIRLRLDSPPDPVEPTPPGPRLRPLRLRPGLRLRPWTPRPVPSSPGGSLDPAPPGSSGTVVSTVTMGPASALASLGEGGGIVFTFPGGRIRPGGDQALLFARVPSSRASCSSWVAGRTVGSASAKVRPRPPPRPSSWSSRTRSLPSPRGCFNWSRWCSRASHPKWLATPPLPTRGPSLRSPRSWPWSMNRSSTWPRPWGGWSSRSWISRTGGRRPPPLRTTRPPRSRSPPRPARVWAPRAGPAGGAGDRDGGGSVGRRRSAPSPNGDGSPRWRPWAWSPSPTRAGDGAAGDRGALGDTGTRALEVAGRGRPAGRAVPRRS